MLIIPYFTHLKCQLSKNKFIIKHYYCVLKFLWLSLRSLCKHKLIIIIFIKFSNSIWLFSDTFQNSFWFVNTCNCQVFLFRNLKIKWHFPFSIEKKDLSDNVVKIWILNKLFLCKNPKMIGMRQQSPITKNVLHLPKN